MAQRPQLMSNKPGSAWIGNPSCSANGRAVSWARPSGLAVDGLNRLSGQGLGDGLRLAMALVVERDVNLPAEALDAVPFGLAVTGQDDVSHAFLQELPVL